jgi:hypothetical protein
MAGDGLSFPVNPEAGGESSALAWAYAGGREVEPMTNHRERESASSGSVMDGSRDRHRSSRRDEEEMV